MCDNSSESIVVHGYFDNYRVIMAPTSFDGTIRSPTAAETTSTLTATDSLRTLPFLKSAQARATFNKLTLTLL